MKKEKLLSRKEYQNKVFARDNNKCVFCERKAVDAHHILDRKLWSDGGYYLSNGASVCEDHHWECEKTTITVESVRDACLIKDAILPQGLEKDKTYDKWGNEIRNDGYRYKGVLFNDDGVQKILKKAGLIYLFYI